MTSTNNTEYPRTPDDHQAETLERLKTFGRWMHFAEGQNSRSDLEKLPDGKPTKTQDPMNPVIVHQELLQAGTIATPENPAKVLIHDGTGQPLPKAGELIESVRERSVS